MEDSELDCASDKSLQTTIKKGQSYLKYITVLEILKTMLSKTLNFSIKNYQENISDFVRYITVIPLMYYKL